MKPALRCALQFERYRYYNHAGNKLCLIFAQLSLYPHCVVAVGANLCTVVHRLIFITSCVKVPLTIVFTFLFMFAWKRFHPSVPFLFLLHVISDGIRNWFPPRFIRMSVNVGRMKKKMIKLPLTLSTERNTMNAFGILRNYIFALWINFRNRFNTFNKALKTDLFELVFDGSRRT